jgi:hypothetical protein
LTENEDSLHAFVDRGRTLAENTIQQVAKLAMQKLYKEKAERMLLASFTSGLVGAPGNEDSSSQALCTKHLGSHSSKSSGNTRNSERSFYLNH